MTKNEIVKPEITTSGDLHPGASVLSSGDLNAIERAVNDAAKRVNSVWLSLIVLITYVFIATGKITHKDLFFEIPVKLPILGVDVPLRGYFLFVPTFVLALHFYFGVQLSGLGQKLKEYERTLSEVVTDLGFRNRLRQRLDNSPFAQILSSPSIDLQGLLRFVAWASMAVAPPWLILFVQLIYLPQQDISITYYHKMALVIDIFLVGFYVLPWMLYRNLFSQASPISNKRLYHIRRFFMLRGWTNISMTIAALAIALWTAFLVAIFPWERSPFSNLTRAWFMVGADPIGLGPATWFSNRLVLSDQNLIEGVDLTKVDVSRAARHRSFYYAIFDRSDLRQVDFTGSDLSFASFNGAKLQKAMMGCAYTFYDNSHSGFGGCTQLLEANFDTANMNLVSLKGAMMRGASLRNAKLNRAKLAGAQLQGANFDGAVLEGADLSGGGFDGATMRAVSLIGATLDNARIRGVNLRNSTLFGASIIGAFAQNASFAGAQLQGALMTQSHFEGADFLAVATYGTDVADSDFSGAHIKNVLTESRWDAGFDYFTTYSPDSVDDDLFGKTGDDHPLGYDYGGGYANPDLDSTQFFADYKDIPASESDIARVAAGIIIDNGKVNPNDEAMVGRLARLKPGTATPDWTHLVEKPASEYAYVDGLGDRLVVIACAQLGGSSVVRGLIRSQALCPFGYKIEQVLKTSKRPDGAVCENLAAIASALGEWTTCPKTNN